MTATTTKDYSYRVQGGRTGVLLIHGLCGAPVEMRSVANGFAREGYTVYCPTLAGHCSTPEDAASKTWADWYRSVDEALTELRKTCDTVLVGGLSTGALLSLKLAADRPQDVQGTLLLAPTLWINGWNIPWYAKLFNLIRNRTLASFIKFPDLHPHGIKCSRVRDFFAKALMSGDTQNIGLASTPGTLVLEHRRLVEAVRPLLKKITQPTLIVHSREDDLAALDNAMYLQTNLGGMVDTAVLDDCYHNVTLDRQRHVVVERTTSFAARIVKELTSRMPAPAQLHASSAAAPLAA